MKAIELLLQGGANPVLLLVVQIALILGLSRLLGLVFTRLHQPQVVGEMLAGIMLGPSLFGWLAPHAAAMVFPATSVQYLNVLSQLGVICFLFLVGLELDPRLILNRGLTPVTFTSRDFASDIACTARLRHVDLIIMGFHNPVYTSSILGGTVHRVMTGSDTDVAIFVDRGNTAGTPQTILVPYMGSKHDRLALELAGRMARHRNVAVTVLHISAPGGSPETDRANAKSATDRVFNDRTQPMPVTLRNIEGNSPVDLVVEQSKEFDLVVIGVAEEWGLESQLLGFRAERIAQEITAPP